MLNKWLEYCVERGHRFPQVKATSLILSCRGHPGRDEGGPPDTAASP
jgi:hypothetical protein